MFRRNRTPVIKFYGSPLLETETKPRPASKFIPDWFKKLKPLLNDDCGHKTSRIMSQESGIIGNATVKKCVPFLDAYGLGYIVPMPVDCNFEKSESGVKVDWAFGGCDGLETVIASHTPDQLKGCPFQSGTNDGSFYKLTNAWHIQTPPGYSSLVVAPLNQPDLPIQVLSGVVDTDTYHSINFPFLLNMDEGHRLIKAGTPVAQIIPFKRESWKSEHHDLTENMLNKHKASISTYLHDFYKRKHHKKKTFI
jgi:hypothetical protein